MTARPIPFTAPMVRAILEGRKTMTRRVLKDQPDAREQIGGGVCDPIYSPECPYFWINGHDGSIQRRMMNAPHYLPGDTLWVREAWQAPALMPIQYRADAQIRHGHWDGELGPWRPSIFMPRWASRIDLRVIAVRVERLQDIGDDDAMSEGVVTWHDSFHQERHKRIGDVREDRDQRGLLSVHYGSPRDAFAALWSDIHGPDAWDENPWVAAITFERIKP